MIQATWPRLTMGLPHLKALLLRMRLRLQLMLLLRWLLLVLVPLGLVACLHVRQLHGRLRRVDGTLLLQLLLGRPMPGRASPSGHRNDLLLLLWRLLRVLLRRVLLGWRLLRASGWPCVGRPLWHRTRPGRLRSRRRWNASGRHWPLLR